MVTSPAAGEDRKGKRPLPPDSSSSEVVSHPTPAASPTAAPATEEGETAAMEQPKSLVLVSEDGKKMPISEPAARVPKLLCGMLDEGCTHADIPITGVYSDILKRIIEYCEKHAPHYDPDAHSRDKVCFPPFPIELPPSASAIKPVTYVDPDADPFGLKAFDKEFLRVDKSTLFEIILAANFLHIEELLDIACTTVADMMRGKKPEEIREIFEIENDYTKEQEQEVRMENAWAFEN